MPYLDDDPARDSSPERPLPCLQESRSTSDLDPWVAPYAACPECCLPLDGYPHTLCLRS